VRFATAGAIVCVALDTSLICLRSQDHRRTRAGELDSRHARLRDRRRRDPGIRGFLRPVFPRSPRSGFHARFAGITTGPTRLPVDASWSPAAATPRPAADRPPFMVEGVASVNGIAEGDTRETVWPAPASRTGIEGKNPRPCCRGMPASVFRSGLCCREAGGRDGGAWRDIGGSAAASHFAGLDPLIRRRH